MIVLAILILIVKAPFLAIGYLAKHKAFLIIAVVGIGVAFLFGQFNRVNESSTMAFEPYQIIAPTFQQAPRVVQTESRIYYVATMHDDGRVLTLTNYYTYNEDSWQHQRKTLGLDRQLYGDIKIYNR